MPILIEIQSSANLSLPTPVNIDIAGAAIPAGPLELRSVDGGVPVAAQVDCERLTAVVSNLAAGQPMRFEVAVTEGAGHGVTLEDSAGALAIGLPEGRLGSYHYGSHVVRPYLWPLYGPGQKRVTRNYPMEDYGNEERDHPHHKSLWTAYDEVNGVNDWSEEAGHGFVRHQRFERIEQGPVFGGYAAHNVWVSRDEAPVLDEIRCVRVYNAGPDVRLLDYDVMLVANHGDVEFGDTKEGGILSVRVASSMDGVRGGVIENANGGRGEAACWGKRAAWCDYSGDVDGEVMGIAMLSNPDNDGGEPHWHARDYGLITTNPIATGAFTGGELLPVTLRSGESFRYRYRVYVHRGDASLGRVAEAYMGFIQTPQGRIIG